MGYACLMGEKTRSSVLVVKFYQIYVYFGVFRVAKIKLEILLKISYCMKNISTD